MDRIAITGGRPLRGVIPISGAKNSALKVMVAALLSDAPLQLSNTPDLADVRLLTELLSTLGVRIERDGGRMRLDAGEIVSTRAPYDLVRKMRATFNVLGPLIARCGEAEVSLPGGCAIGARPVDLHLKALEAMGAEIKLADGYVNARAPQGLKGARIAFPLVSVGATEHAMMAACLAKGETELNNAAQEPEIKDLADCLTTMGATIEGAGGSVIRIQGREGLLNGGAHEVVADRIEAGTFAAMVGAVGGDVLLQGARADHFAAALSVLETSGANWRAEEKGVRVTAPEDARPRPITVVTAPFPGFPTDLQAQFMALAARADGVSTLKETIFENRFMHAPELARLGADISVDGQVATVRGAARLRGAEVMATDLRASVGLVVAALAAEGRSVVNRVYHLDRGFERLEEKLSACGAAIERLTG
ncbi:MAG: UDP-N-acetylglucosamine 1-carboxyvinyltransferase [Pseudomonadota bacterium]